MRKKFIFGIFAGIFVLNLISGACGYDVIIQTSKSQNVTIDKGWQVTNTSDTPLLPEHQYTWNAQKNHLYNPSSLNLIEQWENESNFFVDETNRTIQVRDFGYTTDIFYNFSAGLGIVPNSEFVYQMYADYVPQLILSVNNAVNFSYTPNYAYDSYTNLLYLRGAFGGYFSPDFNLKISKTAIYPGIPQNYPNLLTTFRLGFNRYELNIKILNGTLFFGGIAYSEYTYTSYLDTAYLNATTLLKNISLTIGDFELFYLSDPFPWREMVYAENANWWLPDLNSNAFSIDIYHEKIVTVLGFSVNDIVTFIKCKYINYQKPLSWESRFSQNLTVCRYTDTKYFTEFPQIAYQTAFFPILDTFDVFNVTTNYYVAAWGMLFNASKYNRSLFQIFSTNEDFLLSVAWETNGLFNFTIVLFGVEFPSTLPVLQYTINDYIEVGLYIINNTFFGILLGQTLVNFYLPAGGLNYAPQTLQVYGSLFRGSEIRDSINISLLLSEISNFTLSNTPIIIPLFAQNFFLSKYRTVTQSLTYSFEIVSPTQDQLPFKLNYTFLQSDVYFREGQSKAMFLAQSSRTTLAILYLMRIMQSDIEYSRAELYNRTIYHSDLAGKRALQSIRVDIQLQYVMLTLDYIVPLVLNFQIEMEYYMFATRKPPSVLEFFLSGPVIALFIPLMLLIIFPITFYESSGKRKIFAGIGLLIGIVVNAVVELVDPILSILFAIIASVIIVLIVKEKGSDF